MKWTERIRDLRRFVQTHFTAMLGGDTAGTRDVVGVNVCVDYIAEAEAALHEECLVLLDRKGGVDDRGLVTLARGNQVGGTATPFVEELLEIHCHVLLGLSVEDGETARRQDESEVGNRKSGRTRILR
jgi:hypothetical protein